MQNKDPAKIWQEYEKGLAFNQSLELYETVKKNENFFIGKQWEGLNAPDLEKPVLNFLKRVITYFLSMLVSDDVGISIQSFLQRPASEVQDKLLSREVERIIERTKAKTLNRDALRNAAVDGDACFYLRFDPDVETGQFAKGQIVIDLVDNTNILFGNPYVAEVQDQPYLIIVKRSKLDLVREEAKGAGVHNWEAIHADNESHYYGEDRGADNDLVTVLIKLWKDKKSQTVHFVKCTQDVILKEPTDLGYRLYPVAWLSWEKVKNCFHGQAAITQGVIQNQIYVNTLWALFMIHQKKMAFPKVFYDNTKIDRWTNQVGAAIGVVGNPSEAIAGGFRGPDFSQQAMDLVEKTIQYTKEFMGAGDAALGNVKPDNTSAIIAVQKASSAPLELQRLAFYQFVEDYVRIMVDIIRARYGLRKVMISDEEGTEQYALVDFNSLPYDAMEINVEVGSSAYWSELMQIQTADNLFNKHIITDAITYLETIPDRYIRNKGKILEQLRQMQENQLIQQGVQGLPNQAALPQMNSFQPVIS